MRNKLLLFLLLLLNFLNNAYNFMNKINIRILRNIVHKNIKKLFKIKNKYKILNEDLSMMKIGT